MNIIKWILNIQIDHELNNNEANIDIISEEDLSDDEPIQNNNEIEEEKNNDQNINPFASPEGSRPSIRDSITYGVVNLWVKQKG